MRLGGYRITCRTDGFLYIGFCALLQLLTLQSMLRAEIQVGKDIEVWDNKLPLD